MRRLRVAVVGVGHHGRHHARVCASLPDAELVGVCDASAERAAAVAAEHGTRAFPRIEDLPDGIDAAVVATATSAHLETARFLLERGIPTLVEKPMTATAREAAFLVEVAQRKGTLLVPGYIERFNPVFEHVRSRVRRPRYLEAVRVSPFPFRSVEVGVVMDVMIHDLDLLLSFARAPLEAVEAVGVGILSGTEDIANARLRFADGCIAGLTASRVATKTVRELRIFEEGAYYSLDYRNLKVRLARKVAEPTPDALASVAASGGAAEGMSRFIAMEELSLAGEEPIRQELCAFLDAVRGRAERPAATMEDALHVHQVAEWIQKEIRKSQSAFSAS